MILGILSDTHGRFALAYKAAELFASRGVSYFIHCGDVGDYSYDACRVLEALLPLPGAFVFGNNDFDRRALFDFAQTHNMTCLDYAGEISIAGKRIGVTHGDNRKRIATFIESPVKAPDESPDRRVDYLFTGHTHQKHDLHVNGVRRVNPGALFRAPRKTVATLDLATDTLEFFVVV